jgi:hypothetical protein
MRLSFVRGSTLQFGLVARRFSSSDAPHWRFRSELGCERTKFRSQTAWAFAPDRLGPAFGPFALALRPKSAENRPRKPGPRTGNMIEQPRAPVFRDRFWTSRAGFLCFLKYFSFWAPRLGPRPGRSLAWGRPPPRDFLAWDPPGAPNTYMFF